jgi:hypothetical protein
LYGEVIVFIGLLGIVQHNIDLKMPWRWKDFLLLFYCTDAVMSQHFFVRIHYKVQNGSYFKVNIWTQKKIENFHQLYFIAHWAHNSLLWVYETKYVFTTTFSQIFSCIKFECVNIQKYFLLGCLLQHF